MTAPGTCTTCGGPTSDRRYATCRACSPTSVLLDAAHAAQAAMAQAHVEDVLWLVDSGLPCWEVARRFGVTEGAIARLLYRHGYPEQARAFGRIEAERQRDRERARRPERPRGFGRRLAPCGTYTAYRRHKKWGEPVDDACREAHRVAEAMFRANRRAVA